MTAADGASWADVLQRLRDDLDGVEQTLADATEDATATWVAPAGLGPLPDGLQAEAADLLAGIEAAAIRMTQARDQLGERHLDVTRRRDAAAAYGQAGPLVDTAADPWS